MIQYSESLIVQQYHTFLLAWTLGN